MDKKELYAYIDENKEIFAFASVHCLGYLHPYDYCLSG